MPYRVRAQGLEPPHGSRFKAYKVSVQSGDLVLCKIGPHLIVGRWIPGWIIQPGRLIRITGKILVQVLGVVVPFAE